MIFVSGTDTGCGKTTVGRALCRALHLRGLEVGVTKPVESGCLREGGRLVAADAEALARAAGCRYLPDEVICPNRLELPASPERAAEAVGRVLDSETFLRALAAAREEADFVVAEGAGGLLVPVTSSLMMADVAALLELPLLIVARDALGTVNHTLLTLEAVRARNLDLAGVVFSAVEPAPSRLDNLQAVETYGRVKVLGRLPFLPDADDDSLAAAAEEHLDLDSLLAFVSRRS